MSQTARDWLPIEVVTRPAIRERVQSAAGEWSERWFPAARLGVGSAKAVKSDARAVSDDGAWQGYGALGISISRRAATRLVELSLDIKLAGVTVTPADQRLLDRYLEQMIEDLARSVEQSLDVAGRAPGAPGPVLDPYAGGGLEVILTDEEGAAYATLAVPQRAMLPLCRATLPRPRPPRTGLESMARAVGPTRTILEPRLGAAEIDINELMHLAVGDVLVLDAPVDRGAAMVLAGSVAAFAHATVSSEKGRVTLALQR